MARHKTDKLQKPKRWSVSIALALALAFGGLLVLSIVSVLTLGLYAGVENSFMLLRDRTTLSLEFLKREIDNHMAPAVGVTQRMVKLFERGAIREDRASDMQAAMLGGLSGLKSVQSLMFLNLQGYAIGAARDGSRITLFKSSLAKDPNVQKTLRGLSRNGAAYWQGPLWRPGYRQTYLIYHEPVRRNGQIVGVIVAAISIEGLSKFIKSLRARDRVTPFILIGKDRVLAHPLLSEESARSLASPAPKLIAFTDPILVRMWNPKFRQPSVVGTTPPIGSHVLKFGGQEYIFFYRSVKGYGAPIWTIGAYMPTNVFMPIFQRLIWALIAGLVALLVAIIAAIIIGRRLSRPIRRLSLVARMITALELEKAQDLPPSRIRELNEQSLTFNAVIGAMRWFSAYVPKTIVRHLLQSGSMADLTSDKRNLTVMFTDVAGFSSLSESADASEIARFLNDHFSLVMRCIDDEGGTVDKFIGDSVMAFWGAPEKQKNRAMRACRAALAIRAALRTDNEARIKAGEKPVRMRLGLHSGRATVGNIGSEDRVNYTVIGDMVNVAQRLEQLGKNLDVQDRDATILISADTAVDLDSSFRRRSLGTHAVRGRAQPVEIFELLD